MRRILIVIGILAVSTSAFAQMPTDATELALMGLPEALREEAGAIAWKDDFTYDTLKETTNGLVCYDLTGRTGQRPVSVECTAAANLEREAQNLRFEAEAGGERDQLRALVAAAEADGTRVVPAYGSVWYNFSGNDWESARLHITIATPGATAESLGLPDSRVNDSAWVMNGGTSTSHIMVPGR